jgi:signal peptidase I
MGAARPFRQAGEMWFQQDSRARRRKEKPEMLLPRRLTPGLPNPLARILDWVLTIAFAVALVLVFQTEVAKPYRVPTASMEPTLHCARPSRGCVAHASDRVIALRIVYRFRNPRRGEIAVFDAPAGAATCGATGVFIKRVIGLPGEQVSEREGLVYIDGKRLANQYVPGAWRDTRTGRWPRLGPKQYFVMGDNRGSSCDSRQWGPVTRNRFIGPADLTYWPPSRVAVR